ncbi:tRNA (adenosine(37)-N6)-threonylcarbamoyltransferase complex dimerization subunit type 1 TsaB [Kiritimatiella glycovorans]|uniref:Universal bacterial protein YeaZ n=1 Tax=Kiritimatiella glycovorans TaxID=1307763 RepID=A0A0G3ECZ1_9BACT|nr:tRNA (adenosine(37)-N6)-threonylcarbamoyltransferase complex dimerization subunit type 1 TsaB [Kiritimatiella glycovorans]AKJ64321.1 universal bacterial protein YeaZ [Kiritimatiella glycovorans]
MLTLTADGSTSHGSIALADEDGFRAERTWTEERRGPRLFFDQLRRLLEETGKRLEGVDFLTVGRGPGSFSGLRTSFAVFQSAALPDHRPLFALNSTRVLAAELLAETGAGRVGVCGDARRGHLWFAVYTGPAENPEEVSPPALVPYENVASQIDSDLPIVSPDRTRLERLAVDGLPAGLLPQPRFPSAQTLGEMALVRKAANAPFDDPEPLYLHSAVAARPRFE